MSYHRMSRDEVERWVRELRSDKWQQGRKALYSDDQGRSMGIGDRGQFLPWSDGPGEPESFCCLGVLKHSGILPEDVSPYEIIFSGDDLRWSYFAEMNDVYEWSFAEIADTIEQQFKKHGEGKR